MCVTDMPPQVKLKQSFRVNFCTSQLEFRKRRGGKSLGAESRPTERNSEQNYIHRCRCVQTLPRLNVIIYTHNLHIAAWRSARSKTDLNAVNCIFSLHVLPLLCNTACMY